MTLSEGASPAPSEPPPGLGSRAVRGAGAPHRAGDHSNELRRQSRRPNGASTLARGGSSSEPSARSVRDILPGPERVPDTEDLLARLLAHREGGDEMLVATV